MPVHRPRTPYFADHSSSGSRAELRTLALQPVRLNRGTAYPCTENELRDATTLNSQAQRSYVSAMQASRDVFAHNALGRNLSFEEYDAVIRLENIVLEVVARRREWSPDLIIKAFCDLDLVFFDGFLRGQVYVQWKPAFYFPPPLPRSLTFGLTNLLGGGKAVIHLNVDAIFASTQLTTWKEMWRTMLHEMCHAYEIIRVAKPNREENAHGLHFGTKIWAVHERARREIHQGAMHRGQGFHAYSVS